jgi:hypothetical protein
MAKETETQPLVEQIGTTAGLVWSELSANGQMTLTALGKQIEAPRDVVMQAVGWLAREGKVCLEKQGQKRLIALS